MSSSPMARSCSRSRSGSDENPQGPKEDEDHAQDDAAWRRKQTVKNLAEPGRRVGGPRDRRPRPEGSGGAPRYRSRGRTGRGRGGGAGDCGEASDLMSPPDRMLAEWEARGFSDAQIVTLLVTMLWIVSQDGRVPEHRCPLC